MSGIGGLHPTAIRRVSGHNGHKPKRSKPKRPQTETATNWTATDRKEHKPKRPQIEWTQIV